MEEGTQRLRTWRRHQEGHLAWDLQAPDDNDLCLSSPTCLVSGACLGGPS